MADVLHVEVDDAIALHDRLLAEPVDGAQHNADICPICVDKATETAKPPSDPSRSGGPDVSEENEQTNTKGGTSPMSDSISQETHAALVKAAVEQATEATDKLLGKATADLETANASLTTVTAERDTLKTDNDRLNGELDKAQVDLKAANDKAAALEADIAKAKEDAELAELANARAAEVKDLKIFPEDYVTADKASAWASLDEAAWNDRVSEWKAAAPAKPGEATADTASALSGTTESLTKDGSESGTDTSSEATTSPRRSVLGLR